MSDRPFVDFQQVKEKVSIPDVLAALEITDQFKERRGVLSGVCPLKSHEHGPKPNDQQFKADNKKGPWLWKCFGCDSGGDVIELVKGITGHDNAHVRFWFADQFGDVLGLEKPTSTSKKREVTTTEAGESKGKQADGLEPLRFYLNVDTEAARKYLHSRGISIATAERFGVGLYTKAKKMFTGYLVVPCYRWPKASEDENPIGYVGRWPGEDFDDDHPRYKVGFECSNAVFGLGQALDSSDQEYPLIVVEGPLKALWLIDRGWSNVVSTFTSSVSDRQVELLVKTKRQIVLAFDGDEAGLAGMRTAAAKLITQTGCFVNVVKLPDGKEPDQLDRDELDKFFGFAKP